LFVLGHHDVLTVRPSARNGLTGLLEQLTTDGTVGINSNMKAELRLRERIGLSETTFVELVVWQLPAPVPGSAHSFKYRLALVDAGVCVMRYDNEAGKGDHKHLGAIEVDYPFQGIDALITDFWSDVASWRAGK